MTARPRILLAVPALALALLLGACGSEPGAGSDATGSGGSSSGYDGKGGGSAGYPGDAPTSNVSDGTPRGDVDPDEPPGDLNPRRVEPQPGLDSVIPSALADTKVIDEQTLDVFFYNGVQDCYGLERVDLEYGEDRITVKVFTGSIPTDEEVACIDIAELQVVRVELDEPIEGRRIVDGNK